LDVLQSKNTKEKQFVKVKIKRFFAHFMNASVISGESFGNSPAGACIT